MYHHPVIIASLDTPMKNKEILQLVAIMRKYFTN